jgi:GNAT superfamily N-acetyltransferase
VFDDVSKLERRLAKVQLAIQEFAQVTRELSTKEQRFSRCAASASRSRRLRCGAHAAARARAGAAAAARRAGHALAAQLERRRCWKRSGTARRRARRRQGARRALSARRDVLSFSEQSYAELRSQHDAPRRRCARGAGRRRGDGEARARRRRWRAREQMRAELQRARTQLEALEREKRLHDELDRAYTDLRTDLNVQLRPEMSELASAFLTELTDARYDELELDDSYNLTVIEDGVPKPVISGGEQDIANLCLRLAISQMIAERAGQSFSLLVLDEVFGSLDEARRQNVVELLRGLQDRFEQVILITHIEQVREGLDRVINVRYDEESGRVGGDAGRPERRRRDGAARGRGGRGLMASARSWRPLAQIDGPHAARLEEIPALNVVFSDAFTERYRRDGMVGVRVPYLNPAVWRYAIEDAAGGAMVWRDGRGEIAAFNMVHRSGVEGWMGPLAVRTEYQGSGVGKEVVERGIAWLKKEGVSVIGLETMPRTMDNIGFYSALGFLPGRLTITLTVDAATGDRPPELLGAARRARPRGDLAEARALVDELAPGYDFTREIELTESLALGDT